MAAAGAKHDYEIVISGGSFAGLALARALCSAFKGELRIGLIDRKAIGSATAADARAFAITAAAKHMLEALGIWPQVSASAQAVSKIEITDSGLEAGIRPRLLSYDNVLSDGESASYILPASALQAALDAWALSEPSVHKIAPAEISGFSSDGPGVAIALANGRTIAASLLVAADGKKSALRQMAGIKSIGWPYQQAGIVQVIEHDEPHQGVAVQHFLPGGPFAILPLPGSRSCITWSEEANEAKRVMALDDAAFLSEVDKRVGGRLGSLRLAGPRQAWPLELHLARSYIAPRFALIGDAAHVVHPIAGQGLNLALRDVAALAEVLCDAVRIGLDLGDWEQLSRYERWRRFDSTSAAFAFDGLNRTFSNDGTVRRAVRDFGLGVVDRLPRMKKMFVLEAAGLSGELPRLLKGERL